MTPAGGSERITEILRRLAPSGRRDDGRPAFLDGLLLGAMVGAAIAGSRLWSRYRAEHGQPAPGSKRSGGPSGDET